MDATIDTSSVDLEVVAWWWLIAAQEGCEAQSDGRSLPRQPKRAPAFLSSPWERMLHEQGPQLEDPTTRQAKTFRNRFRVPFPVFKRLVSWTKTWYSIKSYDAVGNPSAPNKNADDHHE